MDYIYNEHFIEHLSKDSALFFIRECKRVLKPGGVLRIATPDLKEIVDKYIHDTWYDPPFFEKYQLNFIKTKAQYINLNFHEWGHLFLYDCEELRNVVQQEGFAEIRFCQTGESMVPELKNIETRHGESLVVEAEKPVFVNKA